jgi:hypothetical protein
MIKLLSFQDARYKKINKYNTAYKWNQGQKSHNLITRYRKALNRIQHPFIVKVLKELGIKGYLNIMKAIYSKPTTNVMLNGEKLKACL